jgi:hypothetical protein
MFDKILKENEDVLIMEKQGRGQLTQKVIDRASDLLGYEINQTELRLIPYICYELVNTKRISNVNKQEMDILSKWVKSGYIINGVTIGGRPMMSQDTKLEVTKEFWDIMNEILYISYVDIEH